MKIIAGWHYDGGAFPDEIGTGVAAEGVVIVGPLGLAGILETRLGLAPVGASQAVRIACYLRAMESICADRSPFYKGAFLADGWATAKRLLAERDSLVFSGWQGSSLGERRLDELAALHEAAGCPPGLPDSLVRVLEAMRKHGAPGISLIKLETPGEFWPKLWRDTLSALSRAGVKVADAPIIGQGHALEALLSCVCPLRATNLSAAADAVSSWLAASDDNANVLLVAGADSAVLDAALRNQGLPITGATSRSAHRAVLQVLPLALDLCWAPLSPAALLDFLTVPVCPLHPAISRRLVRALEKHPGTGGAVWNEAVEKCDAWASKRPDGALLMGDMEFWIGLAKFPRGGELDIQVVEAICERLIAWATTRPPKGTAHAIAPVSEMAQTFLAAVRASGRGGFTKPQIDRILDSVAGGGISNLARAESAVWSVVNHPGQIRGGFQDIIWWNFSDPGESVARPIWDNAEQAALSTAGVDLDDHQRLATLEAAAWRRPLLQATGRFVPVMADSDKGKPLAPHPLWDELVVLPGAESLLLSQTDDAAIIETGPGAMLGGRELRLEKIPAARPILPIRTWPVPPHVSVRREAESPSGMSKLLECPLSWFFRYAIGLRPGHLAALPDGNQLMGSFCHRLVELLIAEKNDWAPHDARLRAEQLFDALLEQMAATLKLPGRDAELAVLRIHAITAIERLFERIRAAGLTIRGCEQRLERMDEAGQPHVGYADLILADSRGNPIPWDMKWNDSTTKKRKELAEGRALQLASYCWLLDSPDAHAGYFMLKQAELLSTPAPWALPQESVPTDLSAVWGQSLSLYHQRLREIVQGEAIAEGVSLEGEALPDNSSRCSYCDYSTICGVRYAK